MITVQTTIQASPDKIWNLWTLPEHITKWCFASDDWYAPKAENDLREGGKFSTTMAAKDGSMSFDFGGIYSAVENQKLIEYVMDDGRKVIIVFEGQGENVVITESFDPESTHPEEMQQLGWQAILNNFKKYVENN